MQANKKDTETFDDDDLDMSSGSEVDFDDDEDPDAIEVPGRFNDLFKTYYLYILTTILIEFLFCACVCCGTGGGRDLATAVSFAKQSSLGASTNQTSSHAVPTMVPTINNAVLNNSQMNTIAHTPIALNSIQSPQQPILQQMPAFKHLIPAESPLKQFLPKVNTASTRVPITTSAAGGGGAAPTTTAIPLANNATYSTGAAYNDIKPQTQGEWHAYLLLENCVFHRSIFWR